MASASLSRPIEAAIRSLIEEKLGRHGLTDVAIMDKTDHDGDPALLIEISYRRRGAKLEPSAVRGLTTELRSILWSGGEMRFPTSGILSATIG